jgi:growth factor-regulated tyrosine kinase substrate
MDNLVSILKAPSLNRDVRSKILRCVQTWAISFKGKYNLSYVEQLYKTLKAEGEFYAE